MDSLILNRGLKLVEEIYDESMYGDKDIYRIKDIIHSLDTNHWKSKQWAADIFYGLYEQWTNQHTGKLLIVGGWYGLLAYALRKKFDFDYHIVTTDMDPRCAELGYKLFHDQQITFETLAIQDIDKKYLEGTSAIFCTSVEHIPPNIIQDLINKKDPDTWMILQSTDMPHKTHINRHGSYQELEDAFSFLTPEEELEYRNWEFPMIYEFSNSQPSGEWNRHMVISR